MTAVTGEMLVEAARTMDGTPFRHLGRSPGVALDCVGLLVCSARRCGRETEPRTPRYDRIAVDGALEGGLVESGLVEVRDGSERVGDVLVFQIGRRRRHLALREDGGRMIHARGVWGRSVGARGKSGARVVTEAFGEKWRGRLRSVWRIPEDWARD